MLTWLDELADDVVDPSSRTPLHSQLGAVLRSRITDGSLPAGSQLPTEAELQEKFGISRSVVRQALLALTAEGLVQRGRGRGSVVAPRGEHHRLVQRMSGLSTQLSHVTTRILALGREEEPAAEAALGVKELLGIRRLRSADGEPLAIIHTWLPYAVASTLTAEELTDTSLHSILRQRFDIAVVAGRRQVRGVAASATLAESLNVAVGAPLLLLEGTSLDARGTPIEAFQTWHRADRVVFDIDVLPGSDARTAAFDAEVTPAPVESSSARTEVHPQTVALAERVRRLAGELAEVSAELEKLNMTP
ncbi:MAG: GntR family transcriptional regulator [Microbacteriaceae bacterium]|nr:GntR family transcriptional regulator [Microbacteriaceae bacterium]HEV7956284.1 GntR family transcriptional regulator [Marisediminicola sp.]